MNFLGAYITPSLLYSSPMAPSGGSGDGIAAVVMELSWWQEKNCGKGGDGIEASGEGIAEVVVTESQWWC